uniref:Uncharacterized protein n=1 Tax=Scleropages formosus TaxID=113540 RepID=A0A8C9S7J0_SCLFO
MNALLYALSSINVTLFYDSFFSKGRVLPPIASTRLRNFLDYLYKFIDDEEKVACVGNGPHGQCFIIYRDAFDKVFNKDIPTREYDGFTNAIKKRHRDARLLRGKLKAAESEPLSGQCRPAAGECSRSLDGSQQYFRLLAAVRLWKQKIGLTRYITHTHTPSETACPITGSRGAGA